MSPYEFALVRYVHDIASGEVVNVGVVLFDREARELHFRTNDRFGRISKFFGGIDGVAYHRLLRHLTDRLSGISQSLASPGLWDEEGDSLEGLLAGVIQREDERLQVSSIMSGVSSEPARRMARLFDEFVWRYEAADDRPRRDEGDVRRGISQKIVSSRLAANVEFNFSLHAPDYDHEFHIAWMNGQRQVLDPISLDLVDGNRIVEKASLWSGRLLNLSRGGPFKFTGVVALPSDPTLERATERALTILRKAPQVRQIFVESDLAPWVDAIRQDTNASVSATANATSPYAS